MKYVANPVEVEAFKITNVAQHVMANDLVLTLENGEPVVADEGMIARYTPVTGDYWVIQSDGYVYLNPREVFERKYHPAPDLRAITDVTATMESLAGGKAPVPTPGLKIEESDAQMDAADAVPFNEYLSPANRPVIDGLENCELVYAEHQPQYIPLRVLRGNTEQVPVLSRWSLTPEQRKAVSEGADIFLQLLLFRDDKGNPNLLQPILMRVSHGLNAEGIAKDFRLSQSYGIVDRIQKKIDNYVPGSEHGKFPTYGDKRPDRSKVPGPYVPPKASSKEVG